MTETVYPECEKWAACQPERTTIEAFLEWCDSKGFELRDWNHLLSEEPQALRLTREQLLASYLEVDLKQLEKERRQILESL